MFQSIKYIDYDYSTNQYVYHLIDSEFKCNVAAPAAFVDGATSVAAVIIPEYIKRNTLHKDIIKNLVLLNMFLLKEYSYYKSFEAVLEDQSKYIDRYWKNINFSKLYYQDVLGYWNNYKNLQ